MKLKQRYKQIQKSKISSFKKCEDHRHTVNLIKSDCEKVLGAFTADNWEAKSKKNVNSSFIFFYKEMKFLF